MSRQSIGQNTVAPKQTANRVAIVKRPILKKDMLFVDRFVIYLDDNDYKDFFQEYTKLCKKYYKCESGENKKGRVLSLISSPFVDSDIEQL
mgnify:CR=1 FL=1